MRTIRFGCETDLVRSRSKAPGRNAQAGIMYMAIAPRVFQASASPNPSIEEQKMSEIFGNVAWGNRTKGDLSRNEKIRYLTQAVCYQLKDWTQILTASQRRKLAVLDWDQLSIPDSQIAKQAEELCRVASPDFLVNHCWRSFIWASVLSKVDGLAYDPEILFVASMLHDLGHTSEHSSCTSQHCFAVSGANAAQRFLLQAGWSASKTDQVADAIALHMNMPSALRDASNEARLLQTGAAFDVAGSRSRDMKREDIYSVIARYPRHNMGKNFSSLMENEAQKWPNTRAALMVKFLQLRSRAESAPFGE